MAKIGSVDEKNALWRKRLEYLLDQSTPADCVVQHLEEVNKRELVAAIAEIRTLDTAVGSGAFPMGVLQALTLALRRLDPSNTLWEQVQKKRAADRAERAFDTTDKQTRDSELSEISATFEKYRQSDFGRKLYLIQNCIYGVDIQPIACQIAKLRFFISLVIEQHRDANAPNFGIKPLPNLETRFVAADTLIGLKRPTQMEIGQTASIQTIEEALKLNRERHFLAVDSMEKVELQRNDVLLRSKLSKQLERIGLATRSAETIVRWDPYNQNAVAQWFDPEYMFGIADGFDVVIGNPPYIQLQKLPTQIAKRYRGENYETFAARGDIYQLFFERGCKLLVQGSGTLAYITSNSWMRAEYGQRLRNYFETGHTPLTVVEMGGDIFDNAIVDTAVLIMRNGKSRPISCQVADIEQTSGRQFPPFEEDWGTLRSDGKGPWVLLSSTERAVMEKIESIGTPLKEWDISIYYGIKTAFNEAFIVNTELRDRLISEDPASKRILKPILRGRDIARYRANWANLWLIDTHNGYGDISPINVNDYHAIKAHLDKFIEPLKRRRDKGVTPYNLRNCAYHEKLLQPKVIWIELVDRGRFAYDDTGMYIEATAFMMIGKHLPYLCAFLNSKFAHWYLQKTAPTSGTGTLRWKKVYVEKIPIPIPIPSIEVELDRLVREARSSVADKNWNQLESIETYIDSLISETYNLSAQERSIIYQTIR